MNARAGTAICAGRPTLGVVAIAKNERTDIVGFVENLSKWVDEVVVVDDLSTDGTPEYLAQCRFPVRVVSRTLCASDGGFAAQRNAGIAAATSDWLLHMDIDERVPPRLAAEMRNAIAETTMNAFRYRRYNFFLHRHFEAGGWQTWNAAQLARRGRHRFIGTLHETVEVEGGEARTGRLREKMWHLNDASFDERLRKNIQYSQPSLSGVGPGVSWLDLLFRPLTAGLKAYFYHGAWRYGTLGLIFSIYVCSGTFNRYVLAWEDQNKVSRESLEEKLTAAWEAKEVADDGS